MKIFERILHPFTNRNPLNLDEFTLTDRPSHLSRHPEYHKFLLELNDYFSKTRNDYVGIAPYGSQLKGVALPDSDFDVIIIGGDSTATTHFEYERSLHEFSMTHFQKEANTPLIYDADFFSINFSVNMFSGSEYYHAAWLLAYPFIGNSSEVNRLKSLAKKRHRRRNMVNRAHASRNFEETIDTLLYEEIMRKETWNSLLLKGYSESDLTALVSERKKFWRKKVSRLLE